MAQIKELQKAYGKIMMNSTILDEVIQFLPIINTASRLLHEKRWTIFLRLLHLESDFLSEILTYDS